MLFFSQNILIHLSFYQWHKQLLPFKVIFVYAPAMFTFWRWRNSNLYEMSHIQTTDNDIKDKKTAILVFMYIDKKRFGILPGGRNSFVLLQ